MTSIIAPVKPHELTKQQRERFSDLVRRVTVAAAVDGRGADLLIRVYMAGLYHGSEIYAETKEDEDDGRHAY